MFSEHKKLKSIVLPDYITKIGERAFEYCLLENVVFPDEGLEVIGEYAFSQYGSVEGRNTKMYNIPSSIKKVENFGFYGVDFGSKLYLPNIEELDLGKIVADEVFLGPKFKSAGLVRIEVNRVIIDESNPVFYVSGQAIVHRAWRTIIGWAAGKNHGYLYSK